MLSVSHAATGAFIAVKVANPALAIPLILVSHYAEDAIPHWDVGTGMGNGTKDSADAFRHEIFDLAFAAVIVIALFPPLSLHLSALTSYLFTAPVWGALVGILPDLLEAPRNFMQHEPNFLRPLSRFHELFHHSVPRIADGLAPQLLLLGILWFLR